MKTAKQLAKELHCHLATVYHRFPVQKKEVTPADVRLLLNQGYTVRQASMILNVSKSTVHRLSRL